MPRRVRAVLLTLAACLGGVALAQPAFDFMPAGGKMLLQRALENCDDCGDVASLAAEERSVQEWRAHLDELGALADFTEAEVATVTGYLANTLPAEGAVQIDDLPRSGREITIVQCTVCHSIAQPMTADHSVERWREHAGVPPHDAIGLADVEWDTLASYLAQAAPIPIEQIPEPLRQGAGGY